MNTDDFESLLKRQPLRPVPPEWRTGILDRASAGVKPVPGFRPLRRSPLLAGLREWLWPHPVAWAGLAAGWVLVGALNSAAGGPVLTALRALPSSATAWAARGEAYEASFVETPVAPLAPPPGRVPDALPRRPGTTWIPVYEEQIA
jgi:hypothetical protein